MAPRSGSLAASAAAVALALVAVACPARDPSPAPSVSPTPSPTPSAGGSVTIGYPAEPQTLDPFATHAPVTRDLARMLMPAWRDVLDGEPVVEQGPPFAVTVRIRDGLTWSDGRPIQAADVRATWQRALRGPHEVRVGFDRIDAVETPTPLSARVVFGERYDAWSELFDGGVGLVAAHAPRTLDAWTISGGPFTLRAWNDGLDMVFERNARAPQPAVLDRLRVVFVPDAVGALELLRRGEVDGLAGYSAPEWERRALATGATVHAFEDAAWMGIALNVSAPGLRDPTVRAALVRAIDRGRIARGLVGTEGDTLDRPFISAGPAAAAPDRAEADRMLDAAGWRGDPRRRGGVTLRFSLAAIDHDELAQIVARAVQFQAAEVGIVLDPVAVEAAELWSSWIAGPRYQAAVVTFRRGPLRREFGSPARGHNVVRLRDAELDRRLARAEADPSAAGPALERIVAGNLIVPIARVVSALAVRDGVCGARAPDEHGPFAGAGEWHRC